MPFDGYRVAQPNGRPLRVALFSGNYNYTLDGANKALNQLVDHLERVEGAQVRVYSPTSSTPAFEPKGELISVPSVAIPTRSDYRIAVGLPATIRRNIEAFEPDIIHLSAPDLLGRSALKLARRLDVPVVASLHTLFETYLDYYALGWLRPVVEAQLRAFYADCDLVMAPSPVIAKRMESEGMEGRMRMWARGVDGQLFDPARRDMAWRASQGFADDEVVVAFFGRVVMEKGLGVFAEAIDWIEAAREKVRVLIIGDGPARPWLAERLPNAVFTGFLAGPDLARALASADIMLNPSKTETFGNVTLEAMACGVPVIGADAPYHHVLVRHGETGLLASPVDPEAYAAAVLELMDNEPLRRAMGRAARAASASYQWSQILAGVVDVYREAMALPSSRLGSSRFAHNAASDRLDHRVDLVDRGGERSLARPGAAMREQPEA
jgi:phosphatidylinositol alpha 1,6-mannosyltransferase